MWGIVIALVSGALMSLQGIFNTEVTKQTSIWVSAGWVQFTALITCILFWFFLIEALPPSSFRFAPGTC